MKEQNIKLFKLESKRSLAMDRSVHCLFGFSLPFCALKQRRYSLLQNYFNQILNYKTHWSSPIKASIDDRLAFILTPSATKIIKMYAKLNQATLDDDYLKIKSSLDKQFFSFDRVVNDFSTTPIPTIFSLSIFMDPNRDLYQRTVFSILDLLGTIGGIFGLLKSVCGFVIGFVSTQIMLSSIFRRLYYTNKFDNKSTEMIRFIEREKL